MSERARLGGDAGDLEARLAAIGQAHVFAHWARLGEAERSSLLADLARLDLDLLRDLSKAALHPEKAVPSEFAPPDLVSPASEPGGAARFEAARARGAELLRAGAVGYVLVAGGQATRLGFDRPKGVFPIGPVSGRTLFDFHGDRLAAIARRTGQAPLWFVMTSPGNHEATRAFFEERRWFGLPAERVVLFPQSTVPAFDRAGKLVLESPTRLFRNPNGHGGVLWALRDSGFLDRCAREGVRHLFYWQVDNPLVRIGDPLFLGLHDLAGAGMSSKVVAKSSADERVGVIGRRNGRLSCIEYSDLPKELRDRKDAAGRLVFRAGNLAIHALSVDFVASLARGAGRLPWHRAEKTVRGIDAAGTAREIPGVKFETFVFDALSETPASVTMEVLREDEFAPVKNADGADSPATAQAAICAYFARWFRKAELPVPEAQVHGEPAVEIHPRFAFDFAEFSERRADVPAAGGAPLFVQAAGHGGAAGDARPRVAVAHGGRSAEREISLRSGRSVMAQFDRTRYETVSLVVGSDGRWQLGDGEPRSPGAAAAALRAEGIDVVFLALHGPGGEDGVVQGLLESEGIPYTGSGVAASALAMDKIATRAVLTAAGIRCAPGVVVDRSAWRAEPGPLRDAIARLGRPVFVKAANQGSSYGVRRVATADAAALDAAIEHALGFGPRVVVERAIAGIEATVPVLGNADDGELRVLPPVEIRPRKADHFDLKEKYDADGASEICPPESLSEEQVRALGRVGLLAHRALGCDGLSRTDVIVAADGPFVLEVNTLPGLTERSLFPRAAAAAGLPFPELLHELVALALARARAAGRPEAR